MLQLMFTPASGVDPSADPVSAPAARGFIHLICRPKRQNFSESSQFFIDEIQILQKKKKPCIFYFFVVVAKQPQSYFSLAYQLFYCGYILMYKWRSEWRHENQQLVQELHLVL